MSENVHVENADERLISIPCTWVNNFSLGMTGDNTNVKCWRLVFFESNANVTIPRAGFVMPLAMLDAMIAARETMLKISDGASTAPEAKETVQ